MANNVSDRQFGYPEDVTIPDGVGVRNEDTVGDERAATVRGRYLARQSDLTDEQAHALAWRELGYTAMAIARRLDRSDGTIDSWLDRTAAQYCLCAIETKWPETVGISRR
jgi:DNA-directed RNA polymerase specialized sigma24 family protein